MQDIIVNFEVNKTGIFSNSSPEAVVSEAVTCMKKGNKVRLRLVKVVLSTGEIEILATNLMDSEEISLADLKDLYHQRWGVETMIDSLKNQFLLTIFQV